MSKVFFLPTSSGRRSSLNISAFNCFILFSTIFNYCIHIFLQSSLHHFPRVLPRPSTGKLDKHNFTPANLPPGQAEVIIQVLYSYVNLLQPTEITIAPCYTQTIKMFKDCDSILPGCGKPVTKLCDRDGLLFFQ